jgi:ABC-2 type transport system permease protein
VNRDFTFLLSPVLSSVRNRMRRRERGDLARALLFGGLGAGATFALFAVFFWLAWQLQDYEELGDYLLRLGLSWLFLTFLSFVAFSALVSTLSTFFLSEDLRLLLAAPIPAERFFYARFARTVVQSSWMVVVFLAPVILAVGLARCAPPSFYLTAVAVVLPFVLIPCAAGAVVTLVLVNVFPARRARDILMLVGLLFAMGLVVLLRLLRPEQLLNVRTLPDITGFFRTLDTPVTPLLPSFWAGESLFAALQGGSDGLHLGALWTTALALTVLTRMAYGRLYPSGWSKSQEARKARFTRLRFIERIAGLLPVPAASRVMLVKDVKVFLRDTTQWSQLLLLLALALVYVYNFRVLDLDRIPYMSGVVRNVYAFVNLAMASFVLSAVAVRFVFPAVSVEGPAFWVVRSAPVGMRTFLWSKYWTGLLPILLMSLCLTVVSNELLGVPMLLKVVTAGAICLMAFALVGLACGLGASHPRFQAENVTQVAGSYGGVAFMVLAVLFIMAVVGLMAWPSSIYLWYQLRGQAMPADRWPLMATCFAAALALSAATLILPMRRGVAALESLG